MFEIVTGTEKNDILKLNAGTGDARTLWPLHLSIHNIFNIYSDNNLWRLRYTRVECDNHNTITIYILHEMAHLVLRSNARAPHQLRACSRCQCHICHTRIFHLLIYTIIIIIIFKYLFTLYMANDSLVYYYVYTIHPVSINNYTQVKWA